MLVVVEKIKTLSKSTIQWVLGGPTFLRWILIMGSLAILGSSIGLDFGEFKVTFLIIWYALLAITISSFTNYVYGKAKYHLAENNHWFILAQTLILIGCFIFVGLVVLGTYIAQY